MVTDAVDREVCNERYANICGKLDAMIQGQKERDLEQGRQDDTLRAEIRQMMDLLRGKNTTPGLIETVRNHDRVIKYLGGSVIFVVTTVVGRAVWWFFTKMGG